MTADYQLGKRPPLITLKDYRAANRSFRNTRVVHADHEVSGDFTTFLAQRRRLSERATQAMRDSLNWINHGNYKSAELPLEAFYWNEDPYDPIIINRLADLY